MVFTQYQKALYTEYTIPIINPAMKKTSRITTVITTFLASLTLVSFAAPQAFALKISIDEYGIAHFYQDVVLGKNDDREQEGREKEEQDGDKQRGGSSKEEQEKNQAGEMEHKEEKEVEYEYEDRPFRSSSLNNKAVVVEPQKEEVRVEIRDRANQPTTGNFERVETMNTHRLEMSTPVTSTEAQKKAAEAKREADKKALEIKREAEKQGSEKQAEMQKQTTENAENQGEYLQRLQEQRGERAGELLEIRNNYNEDEQTQQLQVRSRDVAATVSEGAQLSYDPQTNEVSLVTPSGEEHTLNHLPDQALVRMQDAGLISGVNVDELEVQTADDGQVYYKATYEKEKKLFGLFPRKVKTHVKLDDNTGDIYEVQSEATTPWQNFLNTLSF